MTDILGRSVWSRLTSAGRLTRAEKALYVEARAVFELLEKEVVPHHERWEEQGYVDRDVWLKAGAQGLLCATMPEAYRLIRVLYRFINPD